MAKGYYLVKGDMTTCGGKILGGDPTDTVMGIPVAREQETASAIVMCFLLMLKILQGAAVL